MNNTYFTSQLKHYRLKSGKTQAQIAEAIDISDNLYGQYERGERKPSLEVLMLLSLEFDIPVDCLLNEEHRDFVLTEQQINQLKDLNVKQLSVILETLKMICDKSCKE